MCLPVHACDLGAGGAVELSWSLRPASGPGSGSNRPFVDCEARDSRNNLIRAITRVRLHWTVPGSPPCSRSWACDAHHGATRFEVPQGIADLTVTLECGDPEVGLDECEDDHPACPATYIAPAIVQREAIRGEVVTLGAVELVVSDMACPQEPCTCPVGPPPTCPQVATDHTSR